MPDDVSDNSFRANVCSYDLENYIRTKMVSREEQDMVMLSLQLIILRLCQKLANNSQSQYSADLPAYSWGYGNLANIVRMIRNATNPLQFAIFVYRNNGTSNGDKLPTTFFATTRNTRRIVPYRRDARVDSILSFGTSDYNG